jgi:signal transduction histidine kinase
MFAILTSIIVVFALALTISRPVEKLATFVAKATAEDMPGVDPSILTTLETSKLCEVFSNVMGELRRKIRELTESEKTIRVQKDYIENLHNNLGLAIVVVNVKKGKIEFTNRIAGEQLGITTGGDIEEFSKFKPFKDEDSLTRLILRGCHFQGLWRIRERIYEIRGVPIYNSDGLESLLLIRFQDVSEELYLHEKLERAQKMAYLGGLASSIAHGINNPLGVILMKSEILLADAKYEGLPQKYINELSKIKGLATHVGQIIQRLLLFARHYAGEFPIRRQLFSLNDIIVETLALIEENLRAHNIEVKLNLAENLPQILGDKNAFQEVIINLLDNSVDAIEDNGEISIHTSFKDTLEDKVITITVSDSGCGMSEDVKSRALEPFFTTKDIYKGTGLGLPISYSIIKEHGGDILIESQPGKGTTITISLPLINEPLSS